MCLCVCVCVSTHCTQGSTTTAAGQVGVAILGGVIGSRYAVRHTHTHTCTHICTLACVKVPRRARRSLMAWKMSMQVSVCTRIHSTASVRVSCTARCRPGFGAPTFSPDSVSSLIRQCDFVGVSAYASLNGENFAAADLQVRVCTHTHTHTHTHM